VEEGSRDLLQGSVLAFFLEELEKSASETRNESRPTEHEAGVGTA
jgi:hypothetical protein